MTDDDRVEALLSALSPQQKAAMLQTDSFGGFPELAVPDIIWQAECSHGVKLGGAGDSVDPASGNGGTIYPQNLMQASPCPHHLLPEVIPVGRCAVVPRQSTVCSLQPCDPARLVCPQTVVAGCAIVPSNLRPLLTAFPQAAAFDDALLGRMAAEIAAEMRAIYNMRVADNQTAIFTHCLSPHVAIVRQGRGGQLGERMLLVMPSRKHQRRGETTLWKPRAWCPL